jgi:hypothetical protein
MNAKRPNALAHEGLLHLVAWPYQAPRQVWSADAWRRNHVRPDNAGSVKQDKRRERLAAVLRENLKRRKSQLRSRAAEERPAGDEDAPPPSPNSKG